jgi:hypothetical protein
MPKSKSKNRKRAQMLRKKKRDRERMLVAETQLEKDKKVLRESAQKDGVTIVDRSALGRKEKISSLLLDMIKPMIPMSKDEEDLRGIISMGVVAWNCGIIKSTRGEKELNKVLKSFKSQESQENKKLLDEYIQLKCEKYGQYNDFITNFEISIEDDGRLNFTVLTGVTDDIVKT